MWFFLCDSDSVSAVFVRFPIDLTKEPQKQLKEEKVYLGSQLVVTVHHGDGTETAAISGVSWPHCTHS